MVVAAPVAATSQVYRPPITRPPPLGPDYTPTPLTVQATFLTLGWACWCRDAAI